LNNNNNLADASYTLFVLMCITCNALGVRRFWSQASTPSSTRPLAVYTKRSQKLAQTKRKLSSSRWLEWQTLLKRRSMSVPIDLFVVLLCHRQRDVQPIGRTIQAGFHGLLPATKQPYAALVCRLMVSTPRNLCNYIDYY